MLQPGHQANHDWGMLWVNIGLGTQPANFSTQMMPEFSFTFPSDKAYENQICLPDVTLPERVRGAVRAGDNATIQIVETAKHGGSLYSVSILFFFFLKSLSLSSRSHLSILHLLLEYLHLNPQDYKNIN